MTKSFKKAVAGSLVFAALLGGALAIAQTQSTDQRQNAVAASPADPANPNKHQRRMHMHKSDVAHVGNDAEVAKEFKDEATELREMAASHRKLAELYKTRTSPRGGSYANVAKHCEALAKSYEDAAKAAEAASAELGKK